ncbi:MAG: hypothetical protein IKR48_08280, partial [Kiritimatiellae bacterium]|nr:hypothetical protein [Kiritimatiellia bacterium]
GGGGGGGHFRRTILSGDSARSAAAISAISASMGAIMLGIAYCIANANNEPMPGDGVIWAVGAFCLLSIVSGLYALVFQTHLHSHRVAKRLRIGFLLAFALIGYIVYYMRARTDRWVYDETKVTSESTVPAADSTSPAKADASATPSESQAGGGDLYQDGWYGKVEHEGIQVVINGFSDQSPRTKEFNRRLKAERPVSYAELTIINNTLHDLKVPTLVLEYARKDHSTGNSVRLHPLLHADAEKNRDLLRLVSEPATVSAGGGILASVPVAFFTPFEWQHIRFFRLQVNDQHLSIPGHLLSAQEKQDALENTQEKRDSAGDGKSEKKTQDWYEDL